MLLAAGSQLQCLNAHAVLVESFDVKALKQFFQSRVLSCIPVGYKRSSIPGPFCTESLLLRYLSAFSRSSALWTVALRCLAYAELYGSSSSTCKVCCKAARWVSGSVPEVRVLVILGYTFPGLLSFKLRFLAVLLRLRSSLEICSASSSVNVNIPRSPAYRATGLALKQQANPVEVWVCNTLSTR